MEGNSEEEGKKKLVQVLARAASDKDFLAKLKADPAKTLEEEGIDGDIIRISDADTLRNILRILEELGGILYKRS